MISRMFSTGGKNTTPTITNFFNSRILAHTVWVYNPDTDKDEPYNDYYYITPSVNIPSGSLILITGFAIGNNAYTVPQINDGINTYSGNYNTTSGGVMGSTASLFYIYVSNCNSVPAGTHMRINLPSGTTAYVQAVYVNNVVLTNSFDSSVFSNIVDGYSTYAQSITVTSGIPIQKDVIFAFFASPCYWGSSATKLNKYPNGWTPICELQEIISGGMFGLDLSYKISNSSVSATSIINNSEGGRDPSSGTIIGFKTII